MTQAERDEIIALAAKALCPEVCLHHRDEAEQMLAHVGYFRLYKAAKRVVDALRETTHPDPGIVADLADVLKAVTCNARSA
jgi:hypothetical protein